MHCIGSCGASCLQAFGVVDPAEAARSGGRVGGSSFSAARSSGGLSGARSFGGSRCEGCLTGRALALHVQRLHGPAWEVSQQPGAGQDGHILGLLCMPRLPIDDVRAPLQEALCVRSLHLPNAYLLLVMAAQAWRHGQQQLSNINIFTSHNSFCC